MTDEGGQGSAAGTAAWDSITFFLLIFTDGRNPRQANSRMSDAFWMSDALGCVIHVFEQLFKAIH